MAMDEKESWARMVDDTAELGHIVLNTVFGIKECYDEVMAPILERRSKIEQIDNIRSKRFWLGTTWAEDRREEEIIDSL